MATDLMLKADPKDLPFIAEMMKSAIKDNMAFDLVLYWPELEWP